MKNWLFRFRNTVKLNYLSTSHSYEFPWSKSVLITLARTWCLPSFKWLISSTSLALLLVATSVNLNNDKWYPQLALMGSAAELVSDLDKKNYFYKLIKVKEGKSGLATGTHKRFEQTIYFCLSTRQHSRFWPLEKEWTLYPSLISRFAYQNTAIGSQGAQQNTLTVFP